MLADTPQTAKPRSNCHLTVQNGERAVDNVDVETTWQSLATRPRSQLIDVRTRAEWTYVGIPDLGSIGKRAVLIEWKLFRTKLWIRGLLSVSPASSRRLALNPTTTSSSFAVREAGAWLQLRRWPRRAIGPVTMSLGVSKDRSTRIGTAAPPAAGRRPIFPGFRPSVCPRLIQSPFAKKRSKRPNNNAKASKTGKTRAALLRQTTAQRRGNVPAT